MGSLPSMIEVCPKNQCLTTLCITLSLDLTISCTRFCWYNTIIDFFLQPLACPRRRSVVRVTQTCIIQGQLMQTRLYQVGGTICNDMVRLHSLAYRCGTHGKSSQCSGQSRLGARPGHQLDTDTLRVCQVQWNRSALQPGPVPQSGGGPSPHWTFDALFCIQNGYSGNSSPGPDQWRHGRSRGRCGTRAGRPKPARRYPGRATPV